MVIKHLCVLGLTLCLSSFSMAKDLSNYTVQQHREIKSLSSDDIQALETGSGWGLAKPAELNGIPGPSHVLALRQELKLTDRQFEQIQAIWKEMDQQAKYYGKAYLAAEKKLDEFFLKIQNSMVEFKERI